MRRCSGGKNSVGPREIIGVSKEGRDDCAADNKEERGNDGVMTLYEEFISVGFA